MGNDISCKRLAFAIDFWSKGSMEALFLEHEGYFGALGTFLQSAFGADVDTVLFPHEDKEETKENEHILDKIDDKIGEMTNKVISGLTGNLKNLSPKRESQNKVRSKSFTASRGRTESADVILSRNGYENHKDDDYIGQKSRMNVLTSEEECRDGVSVDLTRRRSISISEGDIKHERTTVNYNHN